MPLVWGKFVFLARPTKTKKSAFADSFDVLQSISQILY